jgi:hypothetical protein
MIIYNDDRGGLDTVSGERGAPLKDVFQIPKFQRFFTNTYV